jgi:hypothetical protein
MSEIPIKNIGSVIFTGDADDYTGLKHLGKYRVISKSECGSSFTLLNDDNNYVQVHVSNIEMVSQEYDHVNPDHYKTNDKQVWEYMIEIYGLDKFIAFCELNVFKYSMRVGRKPGSTVDDDLGKIRWYAEKIKELRDDEGA